MTTDHYRVLGITADATASQVKAAYRRLAKEHHPDAGGDQEEFRRIADAYAVLGSEDRRAEYDATYIDGSGLLREVHAMLGEYVVFPSDAAAVAVTLYAAATHAVDDLECASRLVIKSPVKRCGKSRLLDVLGQLVARPLLTADISAAGLVHAIDAYAPPTVILDEADATFGRALRGDEKAEHLRGLLNAGFTRDRTYTRFNMATRQNEDLPTFAMAVLAGIGNLPDTIEDRAVIITLRRRADSEEVKRFRQRRDKPRVRQLGDRLGDWVMAHSHLIGQAEPDLPEALNDRAQDVWEALFALADEAGGDWPARAREAALALAGAAEEDTLSVRLLADLRDVFGDADRLHTDTILAALHKVEESPWASLRGKPLDGQGLAARLRAFGVGPSRTPFRIDGALSRGYFRADLADTWRRYVPAPSRQGPSNTRNPVTPQVSELQFPGVTDDPVTGEEAQAPDQASYDVTEVTPPPRGTGHPTPEPVLDQIAIMHKQGVPGDRIAAELGVSRATVSRTIKARCRDHKHGRTQDGEGS